MDMKQTLDLSRFLLFEATGDSEDDCEADLNQQFGYGRGRAEDDGGDDDAQSCSYDGSEGRNCNLGEQLSGYESCVSDVDCDRCDGKKKDEEEEEEYGVRGMSYCDDDDDDEIQNHKSRFSVNSGQPLMDEMEKNRKFWEACLAS